MQKKTMKKTKNENEKQGEKKQAKRRRYGLVSATLHIRCMAWRKALLPLHRSDTHLALWHLPP